MRVHTHTHTHITYHNTQHVQHCDKRKVFSFVLNIDEVEQRRGSFGSEFQRREGLKQEKVVFHIKFSVG